MAAPLPLDLNRVDPQDVWTPWQPTDEEWSRKWIAHLFRRAAFGATPAEIDRARREGFAKTLDRLLAGNADAGKSIEMYSELGKACRDIGELRGCWLWLMMDGGHPLREKLTLFWHNHFATNVAKMHNWRAMHEQNTTLRTDALGKFRPLLLRVSKDPAMLRWLDSNQNVQEAPNENFARELMELFTLGIGNYTEKDIREAARAFAGWHTSGSYPEDRFEYHPGEHDDGSKRVFGQTGNWNGEDILRLCCDRPECAQFLTAKLYAFFVSETPPPKGLLAPLDERFRKSDYDIADLAKTMLGSRLFFSVHAYRKRVKWPVEYVLEAVRTVTPSRRPPSNLLEPLSGMGQVLFAPPNVKGWRTGTDWINSATLLARQNFAEVVALGNWESPVNNSTNIAVYKAQVLPGAPIQTEPPDEASAPPDTQFDPLVSLDASPPKNATELVQRMGELLFGEPLPASQADRLVRFLQEPLNPVASNNRSSILSSNDGPRAPLTLPPAELENIKLKERVPTRPPARVAPLETAPRPREWNGNTFDLESPELKARIREALHAMMCLPEYQLN